MGAKTFAITDGNGFIGSFAKTANIAAGVAVPGKIKAGTAGGAFLPQVGGGGVLVRNDVLIERIAVGLQSNDVSAANDIGHGIYNDDRERAGGGFVAVGVITGKGPLAPLPVGTSSVAPTVNGHAAEEIIIAEGVVIIGEGSKPKGFVLQQIDAGSEMAQVIPFIARGSNSSGGDTVIRIAEGTFRTHEVTKKIGMINRAISIDIEGRSREEVIVSD